MNIKHFELFNNTLNINIDGICSSIIPFSELEMFYNRYESSINKINVTNGNKIIECSTIWDLQDVINT